MRDKLIALEKITLEELKKRMLRNAEDCATPTLIKKRKISERSPTISKPFIVEKSELLESEDRNSEVFESHPIPEIVPSINFLSCYEEQIDFRGLATPPLKTYQIKDYGSHSNNSKDCGLRHVSYPVESATGHLLKYMGNQNSNIKCSEFVFMKSPELLKITQTPSITPKPCSLFDYDVPNKYLCA